MKRLMIIVICTVCVLNIIGFGIQTRSVEASSSIYYVAKNGSDSNNGSINSPWLTINHAAQEATAGSTIYIEAGTYNEKVVPLNSGTAGNPITYENYNNETVIIDGAGLSYNNWSGLFDIDSDVTGRAMNYITVEGLTIQNAGSSTIDASGVFVSGTCDHITLSNLTCRAIGESGIYVQSGWTCTTTRAATNLMINGCICYNTNLVQANEGISLINVNGFEIENCTVYDNNYAGGAGIDMKMGCENGNCNNNNVYDCPGAPLIYVDARMATSNINIYDNVLHDGGTGSQGIALSDELGENNMTNIHIYNNLIYNNFVGFAVQDYSPETNVYNFTFVNNTLYNNSASSSFEIHVVPPHTQLSSCVIRNNIIDSLTSGTYAIDYADYANGGISIDHNLFYDSVGAFASGNVFGTSSIVANPLLVSPTTNFALQPGSPAIGAGSASDAPIIDYISTIRTNPPCIGAYEYIPASTTALLITTSSIATGAVGATYSQTLTAAGGKAPYAWTITSGTLPAGLSLSSSGIISGTPTAAGGPISVTIQVTDSTSTTATESMSLTINPVLNITTSSLPAWTVGVVYSQTLVATGGTAPFSWTIASGTLPSGLSLSSVGIISGTPTTAGGPTSVTYKITDNTSATATKSLSITINTSLNITSSSLPAWTVSKPYSQTLNATGGTAPYTWTIASGTLPAGLSFSSGGVISGTPTTAGGPTSVNFQVTDAVTATANKSLPITINAAPSITSSSLSALTIGTTYSQTLATTGGTAPYIWALTSGTLPAGLSLSSGGVISGTPTTSESATSITISVTDSANATASKTLTVPAIYAAWDVNMDGSVNVLDLILIAEYFGQPGTPGWIREDVNSDGVVNIEDLIIVGQHWTG